MAKYTSCPSSDNSCRAKNTISSRRTCGHADCNCFTERFTNTLISSHVDVPLTASLGLKYKRRVLYFPTDVSELILDGLVDTGALPSAIPEADLRKIRLLAPQSIIKEGPAPNLQIMVANGQLETPKSTVELKFEAGVIDFHEIFIVMEKLTSPLFSLSLLQRNNTILDIRQGHYDTYPREQNPRSCELH